MAEQRSPGWIRTYRQVRDSDIWPTGKYSRYEAWTDLLLSANFKDSKAFLGTKLVTVKRGQVLTSQLSLSKRWGWARNTIASFLKSLEDLKMLSTQVSSQTHTGYTLITIENYNKYQGHDESDRHGELSTQLSSQRAVSEHSVSTSEEGEEGEEYRTHAQQDPTQPSRNGKRPAKRPPPDPRVKDFLQWYSQAYTHYIGEAPALAYARDSKLVKQALATVSYQRLQELAHAFLQWDDAWIKNEAGYTIPTFTAKINALQSRTRPQPRRRVPDGSKVSGSYGKGD